MKKLLLPLCVLFTFISRAQQPVVFCPPGAEWHYNFYLYGWRIYKINEAAKYIGDTIIDNETVKIIRHPRINRSCGGCNRTITYIKQHGDTIFMKNGCLPDWQILYNFATPVGGQWISVYDASAYTVTVDSIKTITINGISLKQLITSVTSVIGLTYKEAITERTGGNYLFYFRELNCIDGIDFSNFLCYQDSSFGLYQASSKPCDYREYDLDVGLEEQNKNESLLFYPNPTTDVIKIESTQSSEELFISIIDMYGRKIKHTKLEKEIDIRDFNNGIYILQLSNNKKEIVHQQKLVKE